MDKMNFNGLLYCAEKYNDNGNIGHGSKWAINKVGQLPNPKFEVKYADDLVMEYYENQGFKLYKDLSDIEINKIMHTIGLKIPDIIEKCVDKETKTIIPQEKQEEIDPNFDFTR